MQRSALLKMSVKEQFKELKITVVVCKCMKQFNMHPYNFNIHPLGKETHIHNNSNTSILNRYNQTNKYGDQDLLEVEIKIIKVAHMYPFSKAGETFQPL